MKKFLFYIPIILIFGISSCQKNTEDLISKKVDSIVSNMSLEEKIGQMTQVTIDVLLKKDTLTGKVILDPKKIDLAFNKYKIGSVLNKSDYLNTFTKEEWNDLIDKLQKSSIQASKTPIIYGIDAIHGTNYTMGATLFPQQIGQGASFNPDLVKNLNEMSAYETRASGIPWVFSPVADMGRDPRDPRFWETYGEDPYVNSLMIAAAVKGFQGENENIDKTHVSACLKHYILYNSNSGKDRTPLTMSTRELFEKYVPDFQAGIDAGARSIMVSSGIVNGIPVHSSYNIVTTLLQNELNFNGLIVTDWADIENLCTRDHIASTQKDAVLKAIDAGIDMSMVPYNFDFCNYLAELVKEGKISEERINKSVKKIIKLKLELGLFDNPVTYAKNYPDFGSQSHINLALDAARESITLLKNTDNILPLSKNVKVLVCGPNANSMRTMNGGWSYTWQGEKTNLFTQKYNTFLEAIKLKIGKENVKYEPGVNYKEDGEYFEEENIDISSTINAAKNADYIILFLGENSYTETPGNLVDLYISENQTNLALALAKTGKPIILVLNEGRPRLISKFEDKMQAVLQTYLPSNYGGDALADILFGDINPSGKLPYTYPKFPNSLTTYDYKLSQNKTNAGYCSHVIVQYEFGTGLSYTTFKYSDFSIDKTNFSAKDTVTAKIKITNTGKREGKEVVMLYFSDIYASIAPDNKNLLRFQKVDLAPNETKEIVFKFTAKDLSFMNIDNARVAEEGDFKIMIDTISKIIHLNENVTIKPPSKVKL